MWMVTPGRVRLPVDRSFSMGRPSLLRGLSIAGGGHAKIGKVQRSAKVNNRRSDGATCRAGSWFGGLIGGNREKVYSKKTPAKHRRSRPPIRRMDAARRGPTSDPRVEIPPKASRPTNAGRQRIRPESTLQPRADCPSDFQPLHTTWIRWHANLTGVDQYHTVAVCENHMPWNAPRSTRNGRLLWRSGRTDSFHAVVRCTFADYDGRNGIPCDTNRHVIAS